MNLVNEIQDIKYNYKPNVVILDLKKVLNNIQVSDLIYSKENQYILDKDDINQYIKGQKRKINIITEQKDIEKHLIQTYNILSTTEDEDKFKEEYSRIDWLTTYICALFDLLHTERITLYFYPKYCFSKVYFNDGESETFILLNMFFNQEQDMDELKCDIAPFGKDENKEYKQSLDLENAQMITQLFSKEFSIFPYEAVYENIKNQNNNTEEGQNND